jgi:hypothetical protein
MNKKNLPLIIGIAVPLLMIAFVAVSVYLPVFLTKPQHDFIYLNGDEYGSGYGYRVEGDKLIRTNIPYQPSDPKSLIPGTTLAEVKFYYYDVSEDTSTEISFEKAQEYRLDSNYSSPDGFEVVYGNSTRGVFPFFFGGNFDYNTRYIRGHNYAKKLNLNLTSQDYYDGFRLLGWVK